MVLDWGRSPAAKLRKSKSEETKTRSSSSSKIPTSDKDESGEMQLPYLSARSRHFMRNLRGRGVGSGR